MHSRHIFIFYIFFTTEQREQLRKETTESGLLFVMKLVEAKFLRLVKNCKIIT